MKRISILILFLTSPILFAQHNILNDSLSVSGKIVQKLKREGIAPITLNSAGVKIQGYRICETFADDINILSSELKEAEIEALFKSDHGALNGIAFILFAKRHNNKKRIVGKFFEVSRPQDATMMIVENCSSKVLFSLAHFDYDLLTKPNLFFTPNFKLSKKEKEKIKLKIREFEPYYQ